jgi:hypothetical protein
MDMSFLFIKFSAPSCFPRYLQKTFYLVGAEYILALKNGSDDNNLK